MGESSSYLKKCWNWKLELLFEGHLYTFPKPCISQELNKCTHVWLWADRMRCPLDYLHAGPFKILKKKLKVFYHSAPLKTRRISEQIEDPTRTASSWIKNWTRNTNSGKWRKMNLLNMTLQTRSLWVCSNLRSNLLLHTHENITFLSFTNKMSCIILLRSSISEGIYCDSYKKLKITSFLIKIKKTGTPLISWPWSQISKMRLSLFSPCVFNEDQISLYDY